MNLEIRECRDTDEESVIRLWENAFGDTKDYIHFFYQRLKDLSSLAAFDHGRLVSMLFLLPGNLVIDKSSQDGRYVYAVATDQEYQNQGIMKQLMRQAEMTAIGQSARFFALVPQSPALFSMYQKLGYQTAFYLSRSVIPAAIAPECRISPCEKEMFLSMRQKRLEQERGYFDFYPAFSQYRYEEFLFSGGEILLIQTPAEKGYIAGRRQGKTYRILESNLSTGSLSEAAGILKEQGIRQITAEGTTGRKKPFGMIKLLSQAKSCEQILAADPYMNLMLN